MKNLQGLIQRSLDKVQTQTTGAIGARWQRDKPTGSCFLCREMPRGPRGQHHRIWKNVREIVFTGEQLGLRTGAVVSCDLRSEKNCGLMEKMGKPLIDGLGHGDAFISHMILPTVDFWHDIGATPNVLTTLAVATSGAALYYMYHGCFHEVHVSKKEELFPRVSHTNKRCMIKIEPLRNTT